MSTIASAPLSDRRLARLALLVAALCLVGLALTWVLAELVPITHVKDAVALYDFTRLNRPLVEAPANALLDLLYPPFYAAWGIVLVAIALRRRLLWVALAVAIVLPLAPFTAELLKPLLAHHHDQIGPKYIANASWPSGHATAATDTGVVCLAGRAADPPSVGGRCWGRPSRLRWEWPCSCSLGTCQAMSSAATCSPLSGRRWRSRHCASAGQDGDALKPARARLGAGRRPSGAVRAWSP